jgi:transposase
LYSLSQRIEEMVADKGYHSGAVVVNLQSAEVRTYIPEKKQRGQRHWEGKAEEQQAVYANRRRVKGAYGQRLLRKRGELMLYVLGGAMAGLSELGNP